MFVIKIGGGAGINIAALAKNIASLAKAGEKIVIVNGGNHLLDQRMRDAGFEPRIVTSERGETSRFTDETVLKFLKEIYGEIADSLVSLLRDHDVSALNLSKKDNPIVAKQHEKMRIVENGKVKVIEGDLTGIIEKVESEKIQEVLAENKIPILHPPVKTADSQKELNIDGDKIASQVAIALKADKLIFFANTDGLLKNVDDPLSKISEISIKEADDFAIGRMKKKVLSAKRAIEAGVREVIFADGRIENAINLALDGKNGTRVF